MKKRLLPLLLCVVLTFGLFALSGCGRESGSEQPEQPEAPAEKSYRVALFFANEEYIATGEEADEKYMVYEIEITSVPGDVYLDALEQLKTSPEEGYGTVIADSIKFNDVYMEGDTVFVDLDSNGLNGGSLTEVYLIGQIVNTLINSFDEVSQVQFLVDGETAETLMGHVDAANPFEKDLFTE